MNQQLPKETQPAAITAAIAKYTALTAKHPEQAENYASLGNLYVQQQKWRKAIAAYKQAIKLNPQLARVYHSLAQVLTKLGNERQAADYLYQALKLKPKSVTAAKHHVLGNILRSQGKLERAIACYRQAIQLQPDLLLAYQCLVDLLTAKNEPIQAFSVSRLGVKQNPDNSRFHFLFGQVLAKQEKWQQANQSWQRAIALEPDLAVAYYHRGAVLIELQQLSEAKACYQKAVELQPNYWEAHHQLGIAWEREQELEKSIAAYQQVNKLNPQFIPAYIRLGAIYQQLNQYQQALDWYGRAIQMAVKDSPMETKALEAYQATLDAYPQKTAQLYYQLGKSYRAKGHFTKAIAAYQQAIKLKPEFTAAYIDIQYTSVAPEQLDNLIKFYRRVVEDHPHIPIAWGNLGDALTQQGDTAAASECYRTSCYQKAINSAPHLAKLDWREPKKLGPDFLIVGAAKCGTSSLYNYLSHHPQILLPHKKELDFFWRHFERGKDWYLAHFPSITDRPDFLTGEATPNYLRFPQVAQRIKQLFPQVKIIILLRNPIDRAVSWHYHKVNTGLAQGDFATAFATEVKQLAQFQESDFIHKGYGNPDNLLSSLYIYKIKYWLELLGREQFLILPSEEFYCHPEVVMARVFAFLGLPNHPLANYQKVNVGSYTAIDRDLRASLGKYFQPYNQQLEEYLGIKFNWD